MQALFWMKEPDYRLFRELYPEISYRDLTENMDSAFARLWYFCIYHKVDFLAGFMWRIKNILKILSGKSRHTSGMEIFSKKSFASSNSNCRHF